MKRRPFVVSVAALVGGCSARDSPENGRSAGDATPSSTPEVTTRTDTGTPESSRRRTETGDGFVESEEIVEATEAAREHLAVAFDELRAMRPVGPETIHVAESRFVASDHAVVRERITAAETALDRAGLSAGEVPESVRAVRAAIDLALAGRALYHAVRTGIRAEWRFERHCFAGEWPTARDSAERAHSAVEDWARHGWTVIESVETLRTTGPTSIPRLSLEGWYRDGAVLGSVSGPWAEVLGGFESYAEAIRADEAGIGAMDGGEYERAGSRFSAALTSVREAHRRLARAKADDAQGFQTYALPIRRRCGPFAEAFATQVEAAEAAVAGEVDRAERLAASAMERVVATELEHPMPRPEGGQE
jgi:hypothetical protein